MRCNMLHLHIQTITAHGTMQARTKLWGDLSDGARKQFVYPQPGSPRSDSSAFDRAPPGGDTAPLDTFALIVLEVESVDYVELFKNERIVFQEEGSGEWSEQAVNP